MKRARSGSWASRANNRQLRPANHSVLTLVSGQLTFRGLAQVMKVCIFKFEEKLLVNSLNIWMVCDFWAGKGCAKATHIS